MGRSSSAVCHQHFGTVAPPFFGRAFGQLPDHFTLDKVRRDRQEPKIMW